MNRQPPYEEWVKLLEEAERAALAALEDPRSIAAGIDTCIDKIERVIREMQTSQKEERV